MVPGRALKQRMVNDKEKLYQMYHKDRFSLTDIGEHYGCSRQYVQLIFKHLGIKRRSRMQALKNRLRRRKSKYNFTEDDDKFIIENYHSMTDGKLSEKLGKPLKSIIYRRLIVLGKKKINRRNFTPVEDNFILENYKKMTDIAIAKALKRSLISITHHRNRILKRPKRFVKSYSDKEDDYILKNYKNMTDNQMAVALNRSKASISIHRNEVLGLSKTKRRKKIRRQKIKK